MIKCKIIKSFSKKKEIQSWDVDGGFFFFFNSKGSKVSWRDLTIITKKK